MWVRSVVTDQGSGGSWCGNCDTPVELDLDDLLKRLEVVRKIYEARKSGETPPEMPGARRCPGCGKVLRWGSVSVPVGGSDF